VEDFSLWSGGRHYAVLQMAILQQTHGGRGCAMPVLAGEMMLKVSWSMGADEERNLFSFFFV